MKSLPRAGKMGGKFSGGKMAGGKRFMKQQTAAELERNAFATSGVRRLAFRGGVKRMSSPLYDDTRKDLTKYMNSVIRDTVCFVELSGRKTVKIRDVIEALERNGSTVYGLDTR